MALKGLTEVVDICLGSLVSPRNIKDGGLKRALPSIGTLQIGLKTAVAKGTLKVKLHSRPGYRGLVEERGHQDSGL